MNTLTRREFLTSSTAIASGLVIGFYWPASLHLVEAAEPKSAIEMNAWLRIDTDDSVTVLIAHSEMGQGIYTALPMLVAEELEADWDKIKIVMAPIAEPYKNPLIGAQLTGGSSSIRSRWESLRIAGATARIMLIQAAAERWQVKPETCQAQQGKVTHLESHRVLTYGQLAEAAAKLSPPPNPPLKSVDQFKLIGKPTRRLDTPAKVDGSAIFGIDVRLTNMKIAAVQQAPVFGGSVASYDAEAAKALKVVELPNGIAVVANNYWEAKNGLEKLKVKFKSTEHDSQDSTTITQLFQKGLTETGAIAYQSGDAAANLKTANKTLTMEYSVPFLAHATMEPMNCTADVKKDSAEIWVPTQAQEWSRAAVAKITGLPEDQITLHTTYLGGGFGRRVEVDFVTQAALISKQIGQPVKVIWSREEDMQQDVYRPAMLAKFMVGLDEKGTPIALTSRIVGPSIFHRVNPAQVKNGVDRTAVEGIADLSYDIPHQHTDYVMKNTHIPVGFWRSVGHSHNAFFIESLIDEIAHETRQDPYQLRRTLLNHKPEFIKVLDTLAEKSAWEKPIAPDRFRGMAIHQSFGSIVGQVAEISVDKAGGFTAHRVVCVVDCGIAVNPATIEAQMQGSIVYGLNALKQAITIKAGRVEQNNFPNYPLLTMADMPQIEVHIVTSGGKIGGIGEPGTPPIAPAVTNALFAANQKRIRHLPITTLS
ncbi:MAG: xanthine dehydrogenase family protein molybdopterin-binding subunit [Thioploca sp.]|nr:xanthine dehydrogenase family protein molybdopterin-binding subunit [Thioploca sp.]